MAGLVSYASSDEEEEETAPVAQPEPVKPTQEASDTTNEKPEPKAPPEVPAPKGAEESAAVYGPQLGPAAGPTFPPLEEDHAVEAGGGPDVPPGSPYSANRAMLRDLTLPTLPNMDIPPSPPGSPPPATNKKFEQFLELKKKGVHFNSRIGQSQAMKNPALMDKLVGFVELDQKDQYRTTLGADLWDPSGFLRWAYKEQLKQSQTEVAQANARKQGSQVDFVAAAGGGDQGGTGAAVALQDPAPAAPTSSTGKRKTRFDA